MKSKIALLALLFANSIVHPIYADEYIDDDGVDDLIILNQQSDNKPKDEDESKSENLIKLGASISIIPAIQYQNDKLSIKNNSKGNLTLKADLPKVWCNKDATLDINVQWSEDKKLTTQNMAVVFGKLVTIGHTCSIFSYEKADGGLLISPGASALQLTLAHTFDSFRLKYGIEQPVKLKVGLFETRANNEISKTQDANSKAEDNRVNKIDKSNSPFNIKNSFPAFGLSLGVVSDDFNMGLSGLGRCTDYTHGSESSEVNLSIIHCLTWGSHLGIEYQLIPKKLTIIGQGAYVHGLGDYLSGLSAIQNNEKREEMCSVYYTNKNNKESLVFIDAFGFGGALEYCLTSQWKISIRGSYLRTTEDKQKPGIAFLDQWNVSPKLAYQVNKHLAFSGGYSLGKENRVSREESQGPEHKLAGSVKFSL